MVLRLRTLIIILSALATLGLSGCGSKPAPEAGCNFVQNSYEQRVSWNGTTPIPLYIHESFPMEYQPALTAAINDWETAMHRKLFVIAGIIRGDDTPKRDGISAIYWMSDWEAAKTNEQARTTIYWDGDQIREADMRVNNKDFHYSMATPDAASVDLESLLVHELGHVLGLQHDTTPGSVMAANLANGVLRRTPQPVNVDSLKCEY